MTTPADQVSTANRFSRPVMGVAAASLLLTTACMQVDPNDGHQKQREGIAAGAAVGAITGAILSRDKKKGAIVGAAAGAVAGGLYGDYLDRQEAALRRDLGNNVEVVNTGDRLIVTMPQDILFATDSAQLRPDLRSDLSTVAASLNEYPASTIQVIGHTDNTGDAGYNQQLSQRRANAVAAVLMNRGVSAGRIQAFGRGEDQPKATNLTPEGRQLNRRVEIVILPTAA